MMVLFSALLLVVLQILIAALFSPSAYSKLRLFSACLLQEPAPLLLKRCRALQWQIFLFVFTTLEGL